MPPDPFSIKSDPECCRRSSNEPCKINPDYPWASAYPITKWQECSFHGCSAARTAAVKPPKKGLWRPGKRVPLLQNEFQTILNDTAQGKSYDIDDCTGPYRYQWISIWSLKKNILSWRLTKNRVVRLLLAALFHRGD